MTRPNTILATQDALTEAIEHWRTVSELAIDTESNSFFVYRERTCLIQVSTRDADWIVDPLALDPRPMGELLANPAIEKVLHAAEYDVVSMKRDYGFKIENMFDTLIASKATGRKKFGLGNLIEEILAVKLEKDEQRSDWGRRPLSANQIEYAFADTRFLLPLADVLKADVTGKGPEIVEEVAIDCRRMTEKEGRPREVDPEAFEKHKSARKLDPVSRQILKALYEQREIRARETDRPLFRVVSDETLGEIALRKPATREELSKIPGCTPPLVSRHGDFILKGVQVGVEAGPLPFVRKPFVAPDEAEEERYESLRAWRKKVAEARGVEVDVIVGNAALKVVAKAMPADVAALAELGVLDASRLRRYGDAVVANCRPAAK